MESNTITKPKPKDYTASAVNLVNPPEVAEVLEQRAKAVGMLNEAKQRLEQTIEYQNVSLLANDIAEMSHQLQELVETYGSYQDMEQGLYAIKQAKISVSYDPMRVKANLPKFADAVIEETVNKKAIEGLIKGKLISPEQADACADKSESYAYIIKSGD